MLYNSNIVNTMRFLILVSRIMYPEYINTMYFDYIIELQ